MQRLPLIALLLFFGTAVLPCRAQTAFDVEVTGQGTPMLLIPGLGCDGAVWDATVAHYQDRYECHVLTLAGFAGQPALDDPAPFLPRVRDEIIAYVAAQNLEKPVVVGHSLGGFLALSLGSTAPDRFGPLVVVDGLPFLPGAMMPGATPESVRPMAEGIRAQSRQRQSAGQVEQQLKGYLKNMVTAEADIARAAAWGAASDGPTYGQAMYELYTTDLRPALPKIQAPTLVMGAWIGYQEWGATRASVLANYRAQFENLPHAELEMFDEAKHFIMWDDPAGFLRVLDQFLTRQKS
ncbi:MAG: alpha/beta hydrolase [Catalinimonas sp.]